LANIEDFQCDRIPELYPYKLFDKIETNMKDDKVLCSSESFDLEVYSLEFYDSIHDNIIRVLIASDSKERIEDHFKEVVKKKIYSHLQLYSLKSVNDAFKNYPILVVPNEVNKVVFPELNIEMDHPSNCIRLIIFDHLTNLNYCQNMYSSEIDSYNTDFFNERIDFILKVLTVSFFSMSNLNNRDLFNLIKNLVNYSIISLTNPKLPFI